MKDSTLILGTKIKETEKAVCYHVNFLNIQGIRKFDKDVWFPKSQVSEVEGGVWVAKWLVRKKDYRHTFMMRESDLNGYKQTA